MRNMFFLLHDTNQPRAEDDEGTREKRRKRRPRGNATTTPKRRDEWRPHRVVSQWGFGVTARFWDSGRSPRMSRATGASEVPKPCGDGPCGEVSWDFEVTAGSVTTPFWDPQSRPGAALSRAGGGPPRSRHEGAVDSAARRGGWREGGGLLRSQGASKKAGAFLEDLGGF